MPLPKHVDEAALWATVHWWKSPRPLQPILKRKFKLTDAEAMEAVRAASDAVNKWREANDDAA